MSLIKLFLEKNPNMILVENFVDEGISGKSNLYRDDFQRMVDGYSDRNKTIPVY